MTSTDRSPLEGLGLLDPKVQDSLFEIYAALREDAPVYQIPLFGFWLVTRYDDVQTVLRDPATFSSHYPERFGTGLSLGPRSDAAEATLAGGYPWELTLLFHDVPAHTRHRALIGQAFSPRRVRQLEDSITTLAHDLIDRFPAGGEISFVGDFTMPLPVSVIADALGVDRGDMERFKHWSDNIVIRLGSVLTEDDDVRLLRDYVDFQHYFAERIEERRRNPADDLLSDLVTGSVDGEPLSMSEALSLITLLLVAGNETTTSLLATLMKTLLEHPDLMERVRKDRALLNPVIEETLRLESPLQMFFRKATQEVELGGVAIPAGDMLMVSFGAANRDERRFGCPARFDPDRSNLHDHVAFGFGPHFCPGSVLSRTEARIAMGALLDRIDEIDLAPGHTVSYQPQFITRVPVELPLLISAPRPRA